MTRDASSDLHAEAARQQALLSALWPAAAGALGAAAALDALSPHLRAGTPVPGARGVQAYRLNAGAAAERALSVAFPVVRALMGAPDFAALSRAFWAACPPARGDLAWAGEPLPAFLADDPALRDLPWLPDVARLEWLVSRAEAAADDDMPDDVGRESLHRLADTDPSALALRLAPGTAMLHSCFPVASIWAAHEVPRPGEGAADALATADEAALARVRAQLQAGERECALVWRAGLRVQVRAIDDEEAAFLEALRSGRDLAAALDLAAGAGDFAFDAWLVRALSTGLLRGTSPLARPGAPPG